MKPDSVRKFDWLFLTSIATGLLGVVLGYPTIAAQLEAELAAQGGAGLGPALLVGGVGLAIAINLALWFAISKLRIGFVKWVLIAMIAWSLYSSLGAFSAGLDAPLVCGLASTAMSIAAILYLFRADARAWLAAPDEEGEAGIGDRP